MMPGVSYVIYGCSSARATQVTFEGNIVAVVTQDRVIYDNLRRQTKNQTLCTCRLFLPT